MLNSLRNVLKNLALQVGRTAQVMGELSNCLQATKHLEFVIDIRLFFK